MQINTTKQMINKSPIDIIVKKDMAKDFDQE